VPSLDRAVLITSAGRRGGLLNATRGSLRDLGLDWAVLAADAAPDLSAACHLADRSFAVPPVTSDEYIGALLDICAKEDVALLIPTIDPELLPLSTHSDRFAAKGVLINVGYPDFVRVARDKSLTAERLAGLGVESPKSISCGAGVTDTMTFPALAKPIGGSSSLGIIRYRSAEDYRLDPPGDGFVLQEMLEGPEYTVNVFCDGSGAFRCAVPHRRIEVRAGEVSKGRTERRSDLTIIAQKIATLNGARGAFCFQLIDSDRGPVVFEINARFGGGYPLAHRAGATFVKWLLEDACGLPCSANDRWQDRLLLLRYDAEVFVD
jgi:carbamoyl-phosphate synthase large subunit